MPRRDVSLLEEPTEQQDPHHPGVRGLRKPLLPNRREHLARGYGRARHPQRRLHVDPEEPARLPVEVGRVHVGSVRPHGHEPLRGQHGPHSDEPRRLDQDVDVTFRMGERLAGAQEAPPDRCPVQCAEQLHEACGHVARRLDGAVGTTSRGRGQGLVEPGHGRDANSLRQLGGPPGRRPTGGSYFS
jgi:hypothetical protein